MITAKSVDRSSKDQSLALEALHEQIAGQNMFPFWAVTPGPQSGAVRRLMGDQRRALPFLWSYDDQIEPLLKKSAELVSTVESERRSLILINPGLSPQRATVTTLYSSYRLNDPNEVMPPHRHSPNAIRLGLTGTQNFTGVEGEDITFGPADVVLTPHDTWHNHGNVGNDPTTTLSVLDLPLVETLNAIYFDHDYKEVVDDKPVARKVQSARFPSDYSSRIYGQGGYLPRFVSHRRGTGEASPMYFYRWEPLREMLDHHRSRDGDPYEALMIEYVDPTNGAAVFKTMTFFAQMLRPGESTLPLKQNASLLVTPVEGGGHGYSKVGGKRFDWKNFDTLAVPGGEWCEHVNTSTTSPIILFVASDEPALKAFGLFKKWGRTHQGDVIRLS